MTEPTTAAAPELAQAAARRGVGAADLLWLTWRQHRWTIATGVLLVLGAWGYILWNESTMNPADFARCRQQCMFSPSLSLITDQRTIADIHIVLAGAFGLIIAVFWAAPVIAREYEQRTYLLAWSQDVSMRRWLVGKIVPLAIVATGLAVVLSLLVVDEANRMNSLGGVVYYHRFTVLHFEASVPLQASFALFGFALGVAVSSVTPLGSPDNFSAYQTDSLFVGAGDLDTSGHPVTPFSCPGPVNTPAEFAACERQNHVAGSFIDYQPADRLATFQLIEIGIFLVLTIAACVVIWLRTRHTATTG